MQQYFTKSLNQVFKVSISIKTIEVVGECIVTQNVLVLCIAKTKNLIIITEHVHIEHYHSAAYQSVHKSCPLYACRLEGLEDVHHSLSLQPLQLGVHGDEGTRTTNTTAKQNKTIPEKDQTTDCDNRPYKMCCCYRSFRDEYHSHNQVYTCTL